MHEDPMYALHSIFEFFVSSEAHVLSFLAAQINKNFTSDGTGLDDTTDTRSLSSLLHCQILLEEHIEELQYVWNIFKRGGMTGWPTSNSEAARGATGRLEHDLAYLVGRAHKLKQRVETSISLSMNVAGIGEARRGVLQNKAIFRFTVLAAFYVPLSFTASIFGMNFNQFGQGELSIWMYFLVSGPVFALSVLFLFVRISPKAGISLVKWI